mgnify:CR=1 FL=1
MPLEIVVLAAGLMAHQLGGFKVQGREASAVRRLLDDPIGVLGEFLAASATTRAPDDVAHRCWQLTGGNPLALLDGKGPNACPFYYHLDHLGTPQELTNYGGTIVWSARSPEATVPAPTWPVKISTHASTTPGPRRARPA